MMRRLLRCTSLMLAILGVLSLSLVDAGAQSRKKRRVRRTPRPVVTNPAITPAGGDQDVKIVSTAEDAAAESDQADGTTAGSRNSKKKPQAEKEDMQQTINTLSNQVDRLTNKLSQMQENDRALLDMERLSRAEQRAEGLRAQLLDTETKLADQESKLDQIEFAIKPENIERANASYGSVHPEEARDARRRQLEAERTRTQNQIKLLETSRDRLQTAIANADAEVDLLRKRMDVQMDEKDNGQTQSSDTPANTRKKPD